MIEVKTVNWKLEKPVTEQCGRLCTLGINSSVLLSPRCVGGLRCTDCCLAGSVFLWFRAASALIDVYVQLLLLMTDRCHSTVGGLSVCVCSSICTRCSEALPTCTHKVSVTVTLSLKTCCWIRNLEFLNSVILGGQLSFITRRISKLCRVLETLCGAFERCSHIGL